MSATVGARNRRGEDRFYSPPAVRRHQQQQSRMYRQRKPSPAAYSDDFSPSVSSSFSPPRIRNLTNLDRFLEHTTPIVPAQYFSKTSMRGWRTREDEVHPYFILGDLWESFKEWSAYGAGVPLVLNESDSVVQYYVPYLSGIQLYIDPSKSSLKRRRPGDESDGDFSRETSSDSSSEYGTERRTNNIHSARGQQNSMLAATQNFSRLSLRNNPVVESTDNESEITNTRGLLIFEYLEQDTPYSREPLTDKISILASQFPDLKTYRSCDLTAASWISVAWYPIYRIPTGPTLQNLDACFLTFHSLSTPFRGTSMDWLHLHASTARDVHDTSAPLKLSLPIFGLASYKFKVSVWNPDGMYESQKANSLLHAADNWLRLLQVNHPDFRFFVSRNSFWR